MGSIGYSCEVLLTQVCLSILCIDMYVHLDTCTCTCDVHNVWMHGCMDIWVYGCMKVSVCEVWAGGSLG